MASSSSTCGASRPARDVGTAGGVRVEAHAARPTPPAAASRKARRSTRPGYAIVTARPRRTTVRAWLAGAALDGQQAPLVVVAARTEREIVPEQIAQLTHGPGNAHDLGRQTDLGLRVAPFEALEPLVRLTHFPARARGQGAVECFRRRGRRGSRQGSPRRVSRAATRTSSASMRPRSSRWSKS